MMFEWLVDEMAKVKTRKFYRVDGPLPPDKRERVERSELPVPPSYKSFVLQFGNAKLYWMDPQHVVAFDEPAPEPEDRDRYWEFKPLPT